MLKTSPITALRRASGGVRVIHGAVSASFDNGTTTPPLRMRAHRGIANGGVGVPTMALTVGPKAAHSLTLRANSMRERRRQNIQEASDFQEAKQLPRQISENVYP